MAEHFYCKVATPKIKLTRCLTVPACGPHAAGGEYFNTKVVEYFCRRIVPDFPYLN